MRTSEDILYWLAKRLYRTEIAHSSSMKAALVDRQSYDQFRAGESERVIAAAKRYHVAIAGREVVDLGCNDGSLTHQYLKAHPRRITGVDIDAEAIAIAKARPADPRIEYLWSDARRIPLADDSVDTILCFDVFEHVANPHGLLRECRRILRPSGQLLIGTWGWYHPFAPHLWSTLPVPWAQVFFSERTMLRTCRRVFHSEWYAPTIHEIDDEGNRRTDRFLNESISPDYLNKYLMRDFERAFQQSGLAWTVHPEPFGSHYARWSRVFLGIPWVREFLAAYFWAVLEKPAKSA